MPKRVGIKLFIAGFIFSRASNKSAVAYFIPSRSLIKSASNSASPQPSASLPRHTSSPAKPSVGLPHPTYPSAPPFLFLPVPHATVAPPVGHEKIALAIPARVPFPQISPQNHHIFPPFRLRLSEKLYLCTVFRKRHELICSNSSSNHHLGQRITSKVTKTYLEYALRVCLLHNVLGLVVSLSWIWQGRTLFISKS